MRRIIGTALIIFFTVSQSVSQVYCTKPDRESFENKADFIYTNLKNKQNGEAIIEIGKSFMGTKYVPKTLEIEGGEMLVINLEGLDCTTFMETTLAFSYLYLNDTISFEKYIKLLTCLRYRDCKVNGYSSRMHYLSEWFSQNKKKDYLMEVTKEVGGIYIKPFNPEINFMSTHSGSYKQLEDSVVLAQIKNVESTINLEHKKPMFFVPKDKIAAIENNIQNGDIIGITTTLNGLDFVHVGFAYKQNGRIHLLHASTNKMKVEISEVPLSDYMKNKKNQQGIVVYRIKNAYK